MLNLPVLFHFGRMSEYGRRKEEKRENEESGRDVSYTIGLSLVTHGPLLPVAWGSPCDTPPRRLPFRASRVRTSFFALERRQKLQGLLRR